MWLVYYYPSISSWTLTCSQYQKKRTDHDSLDWAIVIRSYSLWVMFVVKLFFMVLGPNTEGGGEVHTLTPTQASTPVPPTTEGPGKLI